MISCSCHKFIELSFSFEGTTERFVFFFIYIFFICSGLKNRSYKWCPAQVKVNVPYLENVGVPL